eukprot:GDKI01049041.1.p1 GENE.GDKI01049041.1~~GDKI01049041.1.p1  ORF type:complete len:227 (-),score=54.04 GDKI01049041.1:67-747(-)
MVGKFASYGLPTRGAVGISVNGQEIFPLYNNRAEIKPDSCEVDSCNEHVGQGGGQPHLHGDPFGPWCLYSSANYTSTTVHPPQIGWAFDGGSIFGRHIAATNLGYDSELDDCGGHEHGDYGYHYHAQVLDVTVSGLTLGQAYIASTPGVYKCFRGDLSQAKGFWDRRDSEYNKPCCEGTVYYENLSDLGGGPSGGGGNTSGASGVSQLSGVVSAAAAVLMSVYACV